jgi:3-hexulose-6-phosphate synthase
MVSGVGVMISQTQPLLQLAVDVLSISDALRIAAEIYPYFDIIEAGTPLILEEGLAAVEKLRKQHPDKICLADLKIMDGGYIEAGSAFKRGANIVTVLGVAHDKTILAALKAAQEHGGKIMADLINVKQVVVRARELEELGVPIICLHTAYDRQNTGVDPLEELQAVRPVVQCQLAVAGGLGLATVGEAAAAGADILVVGGGILGQGDRQNAASQIIKATRKNI